MKLMILDGNSVINRAFYGIRPLSTPEGIFTNGIYGFLNIMQHMEQEEQPDALCVAFDLHGPTFRHERFDGYKATRHKMPEELAMQMPLMKQVLRALNIPIFEAQGWEADDIIGTVAKQCSQKGWQCVIVTGDRDQLQLIDSNITVKYVSTKNGAVNYTPDAFLAEYGFEPIRLIDCKGLMGDTSDNIPGVPGIGPKSAANLLAKYGTLQGVYDHLEDGDIKGKQLQNLRENRELAFLSYELATIVCNAPIDFTPEKCLRCEPNEEALYEIFTKLRFERLLDRYRLRKYSHETEETAPVETLPLLDSLPKQARVAVVLNGDSLAVTDGNGVFEADISDCVLHELCQKTICCLDSKSFYHLLLQRGIALPTVAFDVTVAAYLLNPADNSYALDKLAQDYLQVPAGQTPAQHAISTWRLWSLLEKKLQEEQMDSLFTTIDLPLCRVLARMEDIGIAVDHMALERFGQMLEAKISAAESAIFEAAGEEFNINSTKKLGEILFEKLELPPVKKTKTGYSTNAEVLEKLRPYHPIIGNIMDYRMLTKLKSTYADGLLKVIAADGRIHTTFQNTVTATGRLSSTDPNLQNIPVRTEMGAEIRKMFVPRPGWTLVDADYSQIELRVLAHIADDKNMQAAFCSGADFHAATASQIFGIPIEEVTPLQRRNAKAVNFGIVYGISKWSLSEDLGVSVWEAEQYINNYLNRFSGVKTYMHDVVENARQTGFVRTMFGRKRRIPELRSSNFNIRSGGERMALNTPIQGTAADIIKLAMLRVDEALQAMQARLLLQVHDELIVECPMEERDAVCRILTEQMEQVVQLAVPLVADAKSGENWYAAK